MELTKKIVFFLLAMILALCDAQNTNEKQSACNEHNMPDLEYQQVAISAVTIATYNVYDSPNHKQWVKNSFHGKTVWVIAACSSGLDREQCVRCLLVANDKLVNYCGRRSGPAYAAGARIILVDCRLRWELYDFDFLNTGAYEHDVQPTDAVSVAVLEVA